MKGKSLQDQEDFIKKFGERVKALRNEKSITQESLANEADISISQVQRIEYGKANPTLATIKVLSLALRVDPKELF